MLMLLTRAEEFAAQTSLFKKALAHTVNRVVDISDHIMMGQCVITQSFSISWVEIHAINLL